MEDRCLLKAKVKHGVDSGAQRAGVGEHHHAHARGTFGGGFHVCLRLIDEPDRLGPKLMAPALSKGISTHQGFSETLDSAKASRVSETQILLKPAGSGRHNNRLVPTMVGRKRSSRLHAACGCCPPLRCAEILCLWYSVQYR